MNSGSAWADSDPSPAPSATPSPSSSPISFFDQNAPASSAAGQSLGGSFQSGVPPVTATGSQVVTNVLLKILGVALQALNASSSPPNTINGTTYTEFNSFGKRVFSQNFSSSVNGDGGFNLGLAPAEIRVPLVAYPVGPIILQIDGGARFQADAQGTLTKSIGIPLELSQLGIQLSATADGAGFIEGYVSFLVLRGGVGGQVDLVDSSANVTSEFSFDGMAPYATVSAMVDFLSGTLYAFVDYYHLFPFTWKRLLNDNLYSWKGYCFATQSSLCPAGK
jgi:hypothetical protein